MTQHQIAADVRKRKDEVCICRRCEELEKLEWIQRLSDNWFKGAINGRI